MKLRYSPTSPYVRKVLVLAHEAGLAHRLELVLGSSVPHDPNQALAPDNPLMKIPVLLLDDGTRLFDSPVIAEYLDSLHGGRPFFPNSGAERWRALRVQALADGMLDAGLLCRYELLRPETLRWSDWVAGQKLKIGNGFDQLEAEAAHFSEAPTIGEIAVGAAIGWIDFRFPEEGWRATHPRLAAWYAGFAERPSMRATCPPAA